jgi:thiol-disulfide isomerase/thioredoxin
MSINPSSLQVYGNDVYINKNLGINTPGMILIHATWCGHCKRFMPEYNKISMKLKSEFPCLEIEESVLKQNPAAMKALNIQGYPTLKFFNKDGKIIEDYDGQRNEKDILNTICKIYEKCII